MPRGGRILNVSSMSGYMISGDAAPTELYAKALEDMEIARVMAFLVSDACSYLNGVDLLYDGGAIAALAP